MTTTSFLRLYSAALVLAILPSPAPLADPISPGFDLFETDPATTDDMLTLPPGTFMPYCDAGFSGDVFFRGVPIDCFGTTCGLAPTDTIVHRLATAPGPGPDPVPIEIVALSLVSVSPITVNCTTGAQQWKVSAIIDSSGPPQTTGMITISQNYPRGGTFTSSLPVQPNLTFTRVSDGAQIGPMIAPSPITFAVSTPQTWCRRANPVNNPVGDVIVSYAAGNNFFPGVVCPSSPGAGGQRRKVLTVEDAALAHHGVLPAEKKHHYKCFDLPPAPALNLPVFIQNQFGGQNATVLEPRYLCPPAIKNGQFGSLDSPHLKCYHIQPTAPPPNAVVDLDGQFGYERKVTLGAAELLCAPTNKAIVPSQPAPNPPVSPHYTCYPIVGTPPVTTLATFNTQFNPSETDQILAPHYLCAPTIKTFNNVTTGSLTEPHLKCYDIAPPDIPTVSVNLVTQFGFEGNVPVGPSKLVCIPVNKRPPECNGLVPITRNDWSATPVTFSGALYDVYKGNLAALNSGYGDCLASDMPAPTYSDPTIPAPGTGFFYLITSAIPSHDGDVESTLGYALRAGTEGERPNANSCSP